MNRIKRDVFLGEAGRAREPAVHVVRVEHASMTCPSGSGVVSWPECAHRHFDADVQAMSHGYLERRWASDIPQQGSLAHVVRAAETWDEQRAGP